MWSVAAAGVLLAFAVTVLTLNLTVYSAGGFVQHYLDALARKDAPAALELVGTSQAGDASDELLVREAMGELGDIAIVSDRVAADGTHFVAATYTLDGEPGRTEFAVQRHGALFGLFNDWAFVRSPLAVLQLTVEHEDDFTANGLDLIAGVGQDAQGLYLVFTPSRIELTHSSQYLEAEPVVALVTETGSAVPAVLDIQANAAFVAEVQRQVDEYLTECTTQPVLQPTGCPFGREIDNRVVSSPAWSMTQLPVLTLEPSGEVGTWRVPRAAGVAHLTVDVQSLFDGSVSTLDEDIDFTVGYTVAIFPGDLLIQAEYVP